MLLAVGLTSPVAEGCFSTVDRDDQSESTEFAVYVQIPTGNGLLTPTLDMPRPERCRDNTVPEASVSGSLQVARFIAERDVRLLSATPAAIRSLPLRR